MEEYDRDKEFKEICKEHYKEIKRIRNENKKDNKESKETK